MNIAVIKFFFKNVLFTEIDIVYPKRNKKIPDILSVEEIKLMIEVTENIKHKLIIKLLYGCGLRVSEIVNLKKKDFDFSERLIHIRLSKGNKDRFVNIPESILDDLIEYNNLNNHHNDENKIFFGSQVGGRLSVKSIQKIVKNASKKARIEKDVYPHLLRHSFATHLLDRGVDIRIIQKLLGHSDIRTTQFYLKVSKSSLKNIKSPLDMID